jgi:hypothetical protein
MRSPNVRSGTQPCKSTLTFQVSSFFTLDIITTDDKFCIFSGKGLFLLRFNLILLSIYTSERKYFNQERLTPMKKNTRKKGEKWSEIKREGEELRHGVG